MPTLENRGWFQRIGIDKKRKQSRRLRVIYNTNMRTAFAAGHWGQAQQVQNDTGDTIYLEYAAILDDRTRPQHRTWDNIILPLDHKFWQHHYPPNGWNCRCTVLSYTKKGIEARGLSSTEKTDPRITIRQTVIRDVKGRGKIPVTVGIDPAFDYNIGKGYDEQLRKFGAKKWDTAAENIRQEMLKSVLKSEEFERFINKGQFNSEYMPVGYMPKDLQDAADAKTGLVYMSGATTAKQRGDIPDLSKGHKDLIANDYRIVQKIFDGKKIAKGDKPNHYTGFIEINGKWWQVVWKTVGDEVWMLTFHRARAAQVESYKEEEWIRE